MARKSRATSALKRHRYAMAVSMRINGDTLQEIADKLGYKHPQCAKQAIEAYYRKHAADATEHRETMVTRNLVMIAQLYNNGCGTPVEAIDRIIKLHQQNAVLLGIGGSNGGTTVNNAIFAGATTAIRCADWTESGVVSQLGKMADDSRRVNAEDDTPALEEGAEGSHPSGNGTGLAPQGPTPGAFGSVPGIADD